MSEVYWYWWSSLQSARAWRRSGLVSSCCRSGYLGEGLWPRSPGWPSCRIRENHSTLKRGDSHVWRSATGYPTPPAEPGRQIEQDAPAETGGRHWLTGCCGVRRQQSTSAAWHLAGALHASHETRAPPASPVSVLRSRHCTLPTVDFALAWRSRRRIKGHHRMRSPRTTCTAALGLVVGDG